MRGVHFFLLIFGIIILTLGCASTGKTPSTQKTQLQIREFQTRTFDTSNYKVVMKASLNVLQDEGYIAKNAVVELGLLTASKEVDIETFGERFWSIMLSGAANAKWKKNMIIEVTLNVSEHGEQTRVRANFQSKAMDNKGGVVWVKRIEDEQFYKDFFSKVDKAIFLQQEDI